MTTTSYHPLTTVYTPPTTCFSGPWTGGGGTGSITRIRQQPVSDGFSYLSECYPSSFYSVDGTYSPGICPSGYTTAYKTVLSSSITLAECCPLNYEGFGEMGDYLVSCSSFYSTPTSIDCSYSSDATTCEPGTVGPGVAEKFAVYVLYEQTDLSLFPAGYTPGEPTSAAASPTSSASPGSAPSSAASSSSTSSAGGQGSGSNGANANSGGLSSGAKAGIGIGVALGVVLAALLLFLLLRRRRRSQQLSDTNHDEPELIGSEKHGTLEVVDANTAQVPTAKTASATAELDAPVKAGHTQNKPELDGLTTAAKTLPASAPRAAELDSAHQRPSQGVVSHELAGSPVDTPGTAKFSEQTPELDGRHPVHPVSPTAGRISAADGLSSTATGPVNTTLEVEPNSSSPAPPPAPSGTTQSPPAGAADAAPVALPTSIEELELQYLENEERRIRERKEAIMRGRTGN